MPDHDPEVVVITGASAGIGRATVREFARHHARIALIAREPERLEAARLEAEQLGAQAIAIPADTSDFPALETAADRVERGLEHDKSAVHVALVDMPGVNTPQFEWCKTTLTHHPKPVGAWPGQCSGCAATESTIHQARQP